MSKHSFLCGRIILMCGLSGCGKSSWIRHFRANSRDHRLMGESHELVVLCPDDYRMVLTGQAFYAPAEEAVWFAVKLSARVLSLQGYCVIIDATHYTIAQRANWIRIAQAINIPISCIHFDIPAEIARKRNSKRDYPVPDEVIDRQAENFVAPTKEEGFDSIYVYNEVCTEHQSQSSKMPLISNTKKSLDL